MWAMPQRFFSTKPAGNEIVFEGARPGLGFGACDFFQQAIQSKPHDRAAKAEA